jgi:hypothetical protein
MISDLLDSQKLDKAVHEKIPVRPPSLPSPCLSLSRTQADRMIGTSTERTSACDNREQAVLAEFPGGAVEAPGTNRSVRLLPFFRLSPLRLLLYLPSLPSSDAILNRRAQQTYLSQFSSLRPSKRLRFLPQLGTVNLTLDMADGRKVSVDATAVQAGVIELFGSKGAFSSHFFSSPIEDLSLEANGSLC